MAESLVLNVPPNTLVVSLHHRHGPIIPMMRENPRQIYQPERSSGLVVFLLLFILACTTVLCVVVVKKRLSNQAAGFPKEAQVSTAPEPIKERRGQTTSFKKKGAAHSPKNAPVLNVTTDSTPVFQSNSANSSMVTSLKKGDEVRSGGLEIIDPRGSLTLVKGQGRSGFVPSEMLERKTPTQKAQK